LTKVVGLHIRDRYFILFYFIGITIRFLLCKVNLSPPPPCFLLVCVRGRETNPTLSSSSKTHPILPYLHRICSWISLYSQSLLERERKRERMFHTKKPSTMNSHDRPMCVQGDSGLVLTTDPKPRLRWTVELHERFVDAVTQLGGPDST